MAQYGAVCQEPGCYWRASAATYAEIDAQRQAHYETHWQAYETAHAEWAKSAPKKPSRYPSVSVRGDEPHAFPMPGLLSVEPQDDAVALYQHVAATLPVAPKIVDMIKSTLRPAPPTAPPTKTKKRKQRKPL